MTETTAEGGAFVWREGEGGCWGDGDAVFGEVHWFFDVLCDSRYSMSRIEIKMD